MKIPMQMGGTEEVATGITGVTAYKSGKVVTLAIDLAVTTYPDTGWKQIGTLPQELKPTTILRFTGYDNTVSTYATSSAVQFSIFPQESSSVISVYCFGDKKTMQPRGSVTYITN